MAAGASINLPSMYVSDLCVTDSSHIITEQPSIPVGKDELGTNGEFILTEVVHLKTITMCCAYVSLLEIILIRFINLSLMLSSASLRLIIIY